ncbi:hypothetical protein [Streptococcus uberis]|uniref:Hypothetical phage protein n=1 Tax=Streptococcus uberis (strain ATCC BAA-854 / 0140J) TaxID=218495 RepID=B9DTA1_STRU0|nr:hypothetical protein [Streptococcus uberis]MCK1159522.1 hypothetical protein [Streptococcus uberis]QBX11969.1 hypothetical protein JavanS621_0010 [Streptococcus satellite phage Javan621]CAR40719.1 hypothetical phage protein [Streptococcus uberis 0140J]
MLNEILEHQPIDDSILEAIEIYNEGMRITNSNALSLQRVYNAGMIAGKRIERAKKCKN